MTRLLDRGGEVMDVYPMETYTDGRGNAGLHRPAATPVRLRVVTSLDRGSIAEVPGQVSSDVLKVITRHAPVGPWARVVYDGREWDLATPPRQTPGATRMSRHTEFTIKSRNTPRPDGQDSILDGYRPPGAEVD